MKKEKILEVIIFAVVLLIPIIYSFFYLKSYWDPYGDLKGLKIAVVNLDDGENNENQGNEFLKSLPREKRIIIVQRYWYLYSIKDIAEKNNLSQSNVKMTLSRFRTKLKEFLEERGQYI